MSHSPSGDTAKPLLRGYSHAVMAPIAVVLTAYLAWVTAGDPTRQVALLVYGCALVLLFTVSATYHIGNWPARAREVLRRFDHSNIFLVIAATYTPITVVLLTGWWRVGILATVWVLALTGIVVTVSGVAMRRGLMTSLYIRGGVGGDRRHSQDPRQRRPHGRLITAGGRRDLLDRRSLLRAQVAAALAPGVQLARGFPPVRDRGQRHLLLFHAGVRDTPAAGLAGIARAPLAAAPATGLG